MSEYNMVKISDFDPNSSPKSELEQLIAIMDNLPDTTVLLLSMPTLEQDKKKLGTGFTELLKYVKKYGAACAMDRETDLTLADRIIRWADKRAIKIERADAFKLQEYVGSDLNTIKNELDKLCNYVGDGGLITGAEIELLVSKRLEANIFRLTDRIIAGDSEKAFEILDALFYQRATPDEIVNIIGMSYLDFYRARVAAESGTSISETASAFGYGRREFALKNAVSKTRSVATESLRESLDEIVNVTGALHSLNVNKRVLVETLVARLVMIAGRR